MNEIQQCTLCGGKSIGKDTCYSCRTKKKTDKMVTRAETNILASIEQEMTLEQAQCIYDDAMIRLRVDDKDQEAWHDKRRAVARLSREEIDTNTLI